MLKRNLILIALLTLILALSANLFGQNNLKTKSSKRKVSPKVKRVNMEDGVFLPGYRTANKHKRTSGKVKSFSSATQPFADGLVLERRRKPKTQSLLPYMEQSNIYRKSKRKRNK